MLVCGVRTQVPGEYILTVLGCDPSTTDCSTPRNHRTWVLTSDDGATWTTLPGFAPLSGSVPDVVRRGDTLYVYTPQTLHRYHITRGVWDPPVRVTINEPRAPWGYVDPSLILDDQGRIAMIYLPGNVQGYLGSCPPGQTSCEVEFLSAVEVDGSDGAAFIGVPGVRVSATVQMPGGAWDPDWFHDGRRYVCYISRGQSVQVFTSSSLHGDYRLHTALPNGYLAQGLGGVPCGRFDWSSGLYWTYAHTNVNGQTVVRRAVHETIDAPLSRASFVTVVSPGTLGLSGGTAASPGIAANSDHMGLAISYGEGCSPARYAGNGHPPAPGSVTFGLAVSAATPSTSLTIVLGTSAASISLSALGWPGCRLLTTPLVAVPGITDAAGAFDLTLSVPAWPSLVGATIYSQAIMATTPGTVTAGVSVAIGRS